MENTENLDPLEILQSAKTEEAKAAEAQALTTIAKPLVEAGLGPVLEENGMESSAAALQSSSHMSNSNTQRFDDIVHVMQTMRDLNVGGTALWDHLAKRLITEAKRVALGHGR